MLHLNVKCTTLQDKIPSMDHTAIEVSNLGKCFRFYDKKWRQLAGLLVGAKNHARELWALRDLNFSLPKGSTLAVIGVNGSGKTTLLQLLAGLMKPTEGSVEVRGNLATLLELGSGFQHDLTGRENIFISSGLRGFSKGEVEKRFEDIVAFSELKEFIDQPIKHYSSGMLMRLAFATAINVQPDVLLIDEVFAVGDMAFQHKCSLKFRELQKNGSTIVLVTHDLTAAKSLCKQALLIDRGSQLLLGTPEEVTNRYLSLIAQKISHQNIPSEPEQKIEPSETNIPFLTDMKASEKCIVTEATKVRFALSKCWIQMVISHRNFRLVKKLHFVSLWNTWPTFRSAFSDFTFAICMETIS